MRRRSREAGIFVILRRLWCGRFLRALVKARAFGMTPPEGDLNRLTSVLVCLRAPCIILPRGSVGWFIHETKPLRGTMSETQQDNSASRTATLFVFVFLAAAIVEILIANFAK